MGNIEIKNANQEVISIEVIRYFLLNGNAYLIYSQNEIDEQQYIKLYCVRIVENGGMLTAVNVIDETEWAAIKSAIQSIIKSNNEGIAFADDLNYHALSQITVGDNRAFKLSVALTDLFKKNKKEFAPLAPVASTPEPEMPTATVEQSTEPEVAPVVVPEPTIAPEPVVVPTTEVSSDSLEQENEALRAENQRLKEKLEQIKNLLTV